MGRARQDIVGNHSLLHVTFRCHNQQFYFHSDSIKEMVYQILLKYRKNHNIHVFDWVIMSNHVHLLVYTPDRETLSRYMHSTNLAIAKTINRIFKKRGQAIEDRFKSPVIENKVYALNTVGYIWLNPLRAKMVGRRSIADYRYSSLYFKIRGLNDKLASDYEVLEELFGFDVCQGRSLQRFSIEWLQYLITREWNDSREVYENLHSVGSHDYWQSRRPIPRLSTA